MDWRDLGRHYNENLFEYESRRLHEFSPIEFGVTSCFLAEHAPESGVAVDIGVGVGHYAGILAARGLELHLVDVSQRLLEAAVSRVETQGYGEMIAGVHHASATDLRFIDDGTVDIVLMLGPLYHLEKEEERKQAVNEARRVLRSGGLLFAAAINLLAHARHLFIEGSGVSEMWEVMKTGTLPEHTRLKCAHLSTKEEFKALFEHSFEPIALAGAESFVPSVEQHKLNSFDEETREAWIDFAFKTSMLPEAIGASDHFLYVGRAK